MCQAATRSDRNRIRTCCSQFPRKCGSGVERARSITPDLSVCLSPTRGNGSHCQLYAECIVHSGNYAQWKRSFCSLQTVSVSTDPAVDLFMQRHFTAPLREAFHVLTSPKTTLQYMTRSITRIKRLVFSFCTPPDWIS